MDARPFAFAGFFVYVSVTGFFMLNLMIAVVCESLIQMKEASNEEFKGQEKHTLDAERLCDATAASTSEVRGEAPGADSLRQIQSPVDEAIAQGKTYPSDGLREYHQRFREEMQLLLQEIRDEVKMTQSEMREILHVITERLPQT
jgi:hypothetical protein